MPQGAFVASSWVALRRTTEQRLGRPTGIAFAVLLASQFHLPFYASRPLANTFALAMCGFGLAAALDGKRPRQAIVLLTISAVRSNALTVQLLILRALATCMNRILFLE